MSSPFAIPDEKLKEILDAYSSWCASDPKESGYPGEQRRQAESLRTTLLNKEYMAATPDEQLVNAILEYKRKLEGPVGIRIGVPRVSNELEKIKRNLLYLTESPEDPFVKGARILKGDYKISIFAKAFWTPLFQAQYPTTLPNWNNKTEHFLRKLGVNLATSKLSVEEKYRSLSKTFEYLHQLDPRLDFFSLNHLMHYGTAVPEGIALIEKIGGVQPTKYWQVAPGHGARLWSELLNNSIAAVGWDELDTDLGTLSESEVKRLYEQTYEKHSDMARKIGLTQLQNFVSIKPGDRIVTNQGRSLLLAVGVAESGYRFRADRQEYKHTVDVDYYKVSEAGIPIPEHLKGKFGKTIVPLVKEEFETLEALFDGGEEVGIWWVNQGESLAPEKEGGFLWAPLKSKSGLSVYHWDNMAQVKKGDVVLHYAGGALRYVSRVADEAVAAQRPDGLESGGWEETGRLVKSEYHELSPPIPLVKINQELRKLNLSQGPIDANGGVKQGYLFRLNRAALHIIQEAQYETGWPAFARIADFTDTVRLWMQNIRTYASEGGRFPYKPVLVLSLLHLMDNLPNHENLFGYDELFSHFNGLLSASGLTATESQFCQPYIRLQNDVNPLPVWFPQIPGDLQIDELKCNQPAYVKEIAPMVRINDLVWPVFSSNEGRQVLRDEILSKWPNILKPKKTNPEYPMSQLAVETHVEQVTLERWVRAIERKGQAIIYGPPGTGKTYVAERLAKHLISGGDGFYEVIQFHPAYAYEDFIQGIRPRTREDGKLDYRLVPGRFLDICEKVAQCDDRCVIILDEINRANLSRVFGELMYLLEYRSRTVPLSGGGALSIPERLRVIGTMNTADRSIALVDHALRRRFAFLPLYPDYDVLRKYHGESGFPIKGLIDTLHRLNTQIGDPHYEVGITFFLRQDLAEHIEDIWRMEIEPYLEEYFFDQRDKVDEFRWEKIKDKVV